MMGSRILSRSFHVEPWREENEEYTIETNNRILEVDVMSDASHQHEPLDAQVDPVGVGDDEGEDDEAVDDDDMEDPADVTMVPMADMLNASFEAENVCHAYCHLSVPHLNTNRQNCSMRNYISRW